MVSSDLSLALAQRGDPRHAVRYYGTQMLTAELGCRAHGKVEGVWQLSRPRSLRAGEHARESNEANRAATVGEGESRDTNRLRRCEQ